MTQLIARYAVLAQYVTPADIAPKVANDPDDDHVLACALAANADLIVSGDAELLKLKHFHGMPIVSAVEAATRVGVARAKPRQRIRSWPFFTLGLCSQRGNARVTVFARRRTGP